MNCIIEHSKNYKDIDTLRQDLVLMDVKETSSFKLEKMSLTPHCTLKVKEIGEFPLTEIALKDALRRGELHVSSCENFFTEDNEILDQVIVDAANAYYKHSRHATSEIKLVTRAGENEQRITLGIPSSRYALLSHSQAVEKIVESLNPDLKLARARVFPEYLEIAFTDPVNTTKDAVEEIVEVGVNFLNSQGTRTRSLITAAFSLRLVCTNGATAKDKVFSARYPHKGNILNGNGEFGDKISEIFRNFSTIMQRLPQLGTIPVTDRFVREIKQDLDESLGVKESKLFLDRIDQKSDTVMHIWNRVTNLPHRIQNPDAKLKLENLGFKILMLYLHQNN